MQLETKKQLTVAIPTWNRQARLLTTLESICGQPEALQVAFLILDNGSDEDYSAVVDTLRKFDVPHRYKRHQQNIGMCANILRCMEESESEWVWILGDDDPVAANALARVMAAINATKSEDIICFSEAVSLKDAQNCQTATGNFQAYLKTTKSLEAISGISENVFRRSAFLASLSHGYHYAMTLFPHLVVVLAMMSAGSKIIFKVSTLLQNNKVDAAERWYWPSWDLGVGLLLDLPFLNANERKSLKLKLIELSSNRFLFIHSVAMLSAGFDRSFVLHVYTQGSTRCFGLWPTVISPYTYGVLAAIVAPKASAKVMSLVYKIARKKFPFSYYTDAMGTKRIN